MKHFQTVKTPHAETKTKLNVSKRKSRNKRSSHQYLYISSALPRRTFAIRLVHIHEVFAQYGSFNRINAAGVVWMPVRCIIVLSVCCERRTRAFCVCAVKPSFLRICFRFRVVNPKVYSHIHILKVKLIRNQRRRRIASGRKYTLAYW